MWTPIEKAAAAILGFFCHASFFIAIYLMGKELYLGLQGGQGGLTGVSALLSNAFLLVQFPILHSFLLSDRAHTAAASGKLAAALRTTTFVLISSVQIILVFYFWSPSNVLLFEAQGWPRQLLTGANVLGWVLLGKSMLDAGLPIQMGYLGWLSVVRGTAPSYPSHCPVEGLFRYTRQPIYHSFTLILLTSPIWTVDRLAIAVIWGIYSVTAPLLKEKRFRRWYGAQFEEYKARTPYFFKR